MSLFDKLKNKITEEKRKQRDNSYLFDDDKDSPKNNKKPKIETGTYNYSKNKNKNITSSPRVKATGDILQSGSKPTASQKKTATDVLNKVLGKTSGGNRFFTDQPDSKTLSTKPTDDQGQFRRNAKKQQPLVSKDIKQAIPRKSKKITVGALQARDKAISAFDQKQLMITAKPGEAAKTKRLISKKVKNITAPKAGEVKGAKQIVKKFTSGVDQRDVSQKAKEFTKKINIKNRKVSTDGYGTKKRRRGQPTFKQVAQDINRRNPTYTGQSGGQLPVKRSKLKTLDTYSKMSTSAVKQDLQKKFGEIKPKTKTYGDLATSRSKALDKIRSIKKTLPKSTRATVDLTKPLAQVRTSGARAFYKPAIKSIPKTFKPLVRPGVKNISKLRGLLKGTSGRTKAVVATASAVASIPLVQRLLKPKNIAKTTSVVAGGETLRRGLIPGSGNDTPKKPTSVKFSLSSINEK